MRRIINIDQYSNYFEICCQVVFTFCRTEGLQTIQVYHCQYSHIPTFIPNILIQTFHLNMMNIVAMDLSSPTNDFT